MKELLRKILLIFLCLYSLFFVFGSILAPICAYVQNYELSARLTGMYMYSCHQQPDRCFWLFGYPMALCCRCIGVYIGTSVASVLALIGKFDIKRKTIIAIAVLAFGDIFINYGLGKLHNTGNLTRFVAGILLGLIIVKVFDVVLKTERK